MKTLSIAVYVVILVTVLSRSSGFTTPAVMPRDRSLCSAVKITGYDDAFQVIDECAVSGTPSEELYDSVRFIDKNALEIYPDESHKQALWDEAHGSWKLQLATGGGKYTSFKKVPIFAFAIIDEQNFGNGVGWNQDSIILSLLGPHVFNTKRRQMVITINEMYLWGSNVTRFVPELMKKALGLGKRPEDFEKPQRLPSGLASLTTFALQPTGQSPQPVTTTSYKGMQIITLLFLLLVRLNLTHELMHCTR